MLAVMLLSTGAIPAQTKAPQDSRPNIIVILVDDMGFSDIGCYGGEIDTPTIDKLASEGLRFTQFYNCGRCCPTRASLLTGLYPHKTGIGFMTAQDFGKPGYRADLNRQCVTIAEALKTSGYSTYMTGKWHVSKDFSEDGPKHNWPLQRGFDKFYGTLLAAGSQWDPITLTEGNSYTKMKPGEFYTEILTNKACEYIQQHDTQKPFFLYLAHTAPHWPLHARQKVIEKYRGRFAAGWDKLRAQRLERLKALGILPKESQLSSRDAKVPAWDSIPHKEWEQSRFEAFAAMVDHIDQSTASLLETLDSKGVRNNTLILFLSDNGGDKQEHMYGEIGNTGKPWAYMRYVPLYTPDGAPVIAGDIPGWKLGPANTYGGYGTKWAHLSNAPFKKFKKDTYEGGISTPMIAYWPKGIKAKNQLRHQPSHVADIMATCLELAQTPYPKSYQGQTLKPLDGKSLLPVFEKDQKNHKSLFWEHHGNRAARVGDWKIVAGYQQAWELYHISKDRTETQNLASQHPEKVKELSGLYDQWAANSDVIPREQLNIPEIPPSDNPLVRSKKEIEAYLKVANEELKKHGFRQLQTEKQ